jgi:hypothetical protein
LIKVPFPEPSLREHHRVPLLLRIVYDARRLGRILKRQLSTRCDPIIESLTIGCMPTGWDWMPPTLVTAGKEADINSNSATSTCHLLVTCGPTYIRRRLETITTMTMMITIKIKAPMTPPTIAPVEVYGDEEQSEKMILVKWQPHEIVMWYRHSN